MRYAKRFVLMLLLVLCITLSAMQAAAANIRFYVGPTGQTLYVRIENPGGNYVATALTEGTSGGAGNYTASEATIAALTGMNSPSTGAGCAYTIRVGTPSASAGDPIVGCGDLAWSGSAELRTPVDTRQVAGTAQTAADLGLAVGTVQTRIGVPVGADLSADIAAKPTAAQIWAALTSGLSTSGSVGKLIVDNLDGKVSSVGSATLTDSDFENVPTTREWKLITNASNELVGDKTLVLSISTGQKTFAVGFDSDLPANNKIRTVDSVSISSGTAGGVTFGTSGRERTQAKPRITGVTAGTYVIKVKVTDDQGNPHTGLVTLKVVS